MPSPSVDRFMQWHWSRPQFRLQVFAWFWKFTLGALTVIVLVAPDDPSKASLKIGSAVAVITMALLVPLLPMNRHEDRVNDPIYGLVLTHMLLAATVLVALLLLKGYGASVPGIDSTWIDTKDFVVMFIIHLLAAGIIHTLRR